MSNLPTNICTIKNGPFIPELAYLPQHPLLHDLQIRATELGYGPFILDISYNSPDAKDLKDNWWETINDHRAQLIFLKNCTRLEIKSPAAGTPISQVIICLGLLFNTMMDDQLQSASRAIFDEYHPVYDWSWEWEKDDNSPTCLDEFDFPECWRALDNDLYCPYYDCFTIMNYIGVPDLTKKLRPLYEALFHNAKKSEALPMFRTKAPCAEVNLPPMPPCYKENDPDACTRTHPPGYDWPFFKKIA